jgi:hypothetical protein
VAEVDIANHLAGANVNYHYVAAVSPWLANARITVNRDISSATIGRSRQLMPGGAAFRHSRDLPARFWVDNAHTPITLVGDQQNSSPGMLVKRFGSGSGQHK